MRGPATEIQTRFLQALLDVAGHCVRTERNHGDVRRGRVYAQDFQGFHTADAGQIDVHQDHRRLSGARYLNAESAVHRDAIPPGESDRCLQSGRALAAGNRK